MSLLQIIEISEQKSHRQEEKSSASISKGVLRQQLLLS